MGDGPPPHGVIGGGRVGLQLVGGWGLYLGQQRGRRSHVGQRLGPPAGAVAAATELPRACPRVSPCPPPPTLSLPAFTDTRLLSSWLQPTSPAHSCVTSRSRPTYMQTFATINNSRPLHGIGTASSAVLSSSQREREPSNAPLRSAFQPLVRLRRYEHY
eukprot:scaffold12057_cov133-Isochrysis_galbana.AAC.8